MSTIYIDTQGASIRYSHGRLLVHDTQGQEIVSARISEVEEVILCANASISAIAMKTLLENNIDTVFLNKNGEYIGRTIGRMPKNNSLRIAQYELSKQEDYCLDIAKKMVHGKLSSMTAILRRYSRGNPNSPLEIYANRISDNLVQLKGAADFKILLGIEGSGTRDYFSGMSSIIQEPFQFTGRNRRPPLDPVNAMFGFSYSLLERVVEGAIYTAGMNPYIGVYHRPVYGRESLVFDLMEEFRPVIADNVVVVCCNKHILDPSDDFERKNGGVYLNEAGRKKFFKAFHARMSMKIKSKKTNRAELYSQVIYLQAYQLARCFTKNMTDYTAVQVR